MRSFFWKIFLSFWIAMALIILANAAANFHLSQLLEQPLSGVHYRSYLRVLEYELGVVMRQRDISSVVDWLHARQAHFAPEIYIVDHQGNDITGQIKPQRLRQHLRPYIERGWPYTSSNRLPMPYRTIYDKENTPYYLVVDLSAFGEVYVFLQSYGSWLQILSAILLSGLVCFYLARYLVSPVQHLRNATRELAAGNLSKRVGSAIGKRKDEIADLGRDFDQMAERIETLVNAQKQLLRDISHELRSPLARLSVALGLARQRSMEQISAPLNRIERETERLNDLIGQILSIARLETQAEHVQLEPVDLQEILEIVVQDAKYEAAQLNRGVQIKQSFPLTLQANGELLHRALENVIRNALRYTSEGTNVEVTMRVYSDAKKWVSIEVRDYGPGVPEKDLPHLFEPFVRVADARDRDSGGYGLGLAIAEGAARVHSGILSARNDIQKGLLVTLSLPVHEAHAQNQDET